ncbi:alpha/beta hydrolase [Reinekea sp. G2M2-21]|uniref:alpha/beta hydrolase n=1 Tax=Reinekea sp. G2M2-21 TaxID=2788942 RepID=UPI0018AA526B|nr:alpha/beta hydrolase [Reinekea sp. G2M2-21]
MKKPMQLLLMLTVAISLSSCSLLATSYTNLNPESQWAGFQATTSESSGWLIYKHQESPSRAIVFYPGGKVEPEAYGEFADALSKQVQALVIIVPMPLDLAVLGSKRANKVRRAFPNIEQWYIAGHSLGGTMAADLAYKQPGFWQGLILLASYAQEKQDFSDRNLPVASIIGTRDGLISQDKWETTLKRLPNNALTLAIEGGNHAGFGTYGPQEGDSDALISPWKQQQITIEALVNWILGQSNP